MRKTLLCLSLVLMLAVCSSIAHGQVKATPTPAPSPTPSLPASVEIAGSDAKIIRDVQRESRNATLEAENLQLRIEQATAQLKTLQEKAVSERQRWQTTLSTITKIPVNALNEYQIMEREGKIVLTHFPAKP